MQKLYLPDNHENVDVITLSAAAGKAFVAATAKYEIHRHQVETNKCLPRKTLDFENKKL